MNRRKFLAFLGIAPFAPALTKVEAAIPEVVYTPLVQREVYFGPSLVEMILKQQELTKKAMLENIAANHWSDIDERL